MCLVIVSLLSVCVDVCAEMLLSGGCVVSLTVGVDGCGEMVGVWCQCWLAHSVCRRVR